MPENNIHKILRNTFPKSTREIWQQAASKEIDGENPFKKLIWESSDQIKFYPYYDHTDVAHLEYLKQNQLTVGENSFLGPNAWLSIPCITVNENREANKSALEHMINGADGVLFILNGSSDLQQLLHQVEWNHCSLFFRTTENIFYKQKLPEFILQRNFNTDALTGALFWESSPKKGDLDFYLKNTKNFKSLGISIAPSTAVKEMAEGLTRAVNIIEELKSDAASVASLIQSVAFSVSLNNIFFESMAKLKALRLLWYQVAQAYGVKNYTPSHLHIHVVSQTWVSEKFEPHGNMLKGTLASMAGVLGGCDSLTVHAQDEQNQTMSRIARNISVVLREESHLNKVADPIAGAYAIENMVNDIAKDAWNLFQSNMKL